MRPKLSLALLLANVVLWSHFGYSEEKIRIGISAVSLGFLPTVVAEKKGFYAKYGLAPEHVLVPCAIATNAILSEDLDYNVCTGPGIAGAIKGLPIKLVMTTQDKLGYLLLVKPKRAETRRPSRQNHRHQHFRQPVISHVDDSLSPSRFGTRERYQSPPWRGQQRQIGGDGNGQGGRGFRFFAVGYLRREERI